METFEEWSNQLEERVLRHDVLVDKFTKELRTTMIEEEDQENEEKFRRRMEEKLEIEKKKKLKTQKKSYELTRETVPEKRYTNIKLTKFIITKFEGTHTDWFGFWDRCESEIDKLELHPVSKFNYLKELLPQKIRLLINTLPFTSEGYSNALAILKLMFWKPSEVSATHIQCITSLPVITNSNPNQIHEFYERLVISVEGLETKNKLKQINGHMRLTF